MPALRELADDDHSLHTMNGAAARKKAAQARWQRENPAKRAEHQRRYRAKQSTREKEKKYKVEWRAKNPEKAAEIKARYLRNNRDIVRERARRAQIRRKYGLTPDQVAAMLAAQGGGCAICKATHPGWNHAWPVDHCHTTGRIRGILCVHCNRMLHGLATVDVLQAAIEYLRST